MTIDEMKARKDALGYSCEQISALSHVPLGTVQKIFGGVTKRPRFETLRALERVLNPGSTEAYHTEPDAPSHVREAALSYHTGWEQGEYTLRDYYALPSDRRAELIDGVLYDMAAPSYLHQLICGELYARLREYIRANHGLCVVSQAPLDVQLDRDERTMLQPDVMVVCDRGRIRNRCLYGAPDLVIEVLSDSTRRRDMSLKLSKYMYAGVREYWLVDPDRRKVVVYDLEHEELPALYGFDSTIPVRIWDGQCQIDFSDIYEYIRFLYEEPAAPQPQ